MIALALTMPRASFLAQGMRHLRPGGQSRKEKPA